MAPPTPVFGREELEMVRIKAKGPCQLKSLVQNECEFNGHNYVCIPFKRVFEECIVGGKQQKIRLEVTSESTNAVIDATVARFWSSVKKLE
ncbi:LAME_0D10924g1_1 [Lachancea meyersii CBS 8951]|uniref:LAME_0D10924g1_1 n=1 Tax=Lachancea meyersii CBS 8951 TaxID=1266667 RepID=A0A1G4JBZ5_9SACH|nr:LAME_0D10924g1_1 [Lachancea meyersii CBS 8951]